MSLFKETIDPKISGSLALKQELMGKENRTPKEISFLNSNTSWVSLKSAVDIDNNADSAKSNVLEGGSIHNGKLRYGVGVDSSNAYSLKATSGENNILGIRPMPAREQTIKLLFKNRPKPEDSKKHEIKCRSLQQKKIYINQWGQVSACYTHAENEQDYFPTDVEDMDYSDILSFKFPDCFLCEKRTRTFIDKMGLDFVC